MSEQFFTNESAGVIREVLDIFQENGYGPLPDYRSDPFFTQLLTVGVQTGGKKLGDYIITLLVAERGKHLQIHSYIKAVARELTNGLPGYAGRISEPSFQDVLARLIMAIILDPSEELFSDQGLQVVRSVLYGQAVPDYGKGPIKNIEDFPNPKQTLQDLRLLESNAEPWSLPQQWLMISPRLDQKGLAKALTSQKGFEEIKKSYARTKRFVANCRSIRDVNPIVDEDEQLLFDKRIDEALIGILSLSGMFDFSARDIFDDVTDYAGGRYRRLLFAPPSPPDDKDVMQDIVSKLHPDAIVFLREHVPGIRIWAEEYMDEAEGNLQTRNEIGAA
ncbi:hypothetical protein KC640_03105, partial [Candidatus Dojkabacteria bacterium]|nr:hypothetical protein [Candidatus Dojkabacteria bacterium]